MIQRSRKPVKTEVVLGSKLVNENNINTKPKKKKPINEFVGGSKLVNENNIIINMPEPVKKKRKKKPKMQAEPEGISDEAKRNFQETSSQYARGSYPPIPDSIDISKIKTTSALNAFTNTLRTTMGLPPVVPITSTTSPTVPVVPVRPVLTETTTTDASIPAVATTSDLSPPIASDVPTLTPPIPTVLLENEKEFIGLFDYIFTSVENFYEKKDNTINFLIGLNYYKNNKNLFDNTSNDKVKEHINKYIPKNYFDMEDDFNNTLYEDYKELFEEFKLSSVLDKDKLIKSNKKESDISKTLIDEEKEKLKNEVIELSKDREKLSDELDKLKTSKNNLFDTDPLYNELQKQIEKNVDLEEEKQQLKEEIEKMLKEKNNKSIKNLIREKKNINQKLDENDDALTPEQLADFMETLLTGRTDNQLIKASYMSGGSSSMMSTPQAVMSSNVPVISGGSQSFMPVTQQPQTQPQVQAPPKNPDFIYNYVSGQANNYDPKRYGEAGLAEATSNPEIFYKTFYHNGEYKQKTFPLDDPKLALYPQKPDFLRVIKNIPSNAGVSSKDVPQLIIIFKEEYLKSLEIPKNVPVDLPKIDKSLQGIDKLMNFMDVYFPSNGLNRVFLPIAPLGNSTNKENNPTEKELIKIINEFIIPKKEEYKSHYYEQYTTSGKNYKKGEYKPYLIGSSLQQSSVSARDKAAIELLKDFTELYPEPEPEPEVNKTISPTKEDKVLLRTYADDEDLEQLQTLYKKYYEKDFIYNPDRTEVGEKVFDIVEAFKKGIVQPETGTTETGTQPETGTTETGTQPETGTGTQPETGTTETGTQPETGTGTQPETGTGTQPETGTGTQPETGTGTQPETDSQTGEECLDPSRRSADCVKISDYYRYLNDLSKKNEIQELTDEYIKATKDDFNFINASNNIKIEKIKESNYKPSEITNADFFDWYAKDKLKTVDPIITTSPEIAFLTPDEYKRTIVLLTVENDTDKINAYFKGLMQWNADNGFFERIPRNISTEDKLAMLIRYKNQYQYIDINEAVKRKKTLNDNNEVQLCFEICKATYLEPSSREQIGQLDYDDSLSNSEVAIYRDTTTNIIYFGSRGSQTAEDWLKSDLAIVFGGATPNYSPRLNNEITILNQVISIYRPTTIIYTGHSLAAYLSDELFIYTLKTIPSITQVFSIGFNGGRGLPAYYRDNPFNENYINSHVLQFHIKGDVLSMTQRYAPFGTLVNVPVSSLLLIPNHFLSAYDDFSFEPYANFVDIGLTIPNPDQVVEEEIVNEKGPKLLNLLGQLFELDENERYNQETEQYINAAIYYDDNKEYFNSLNIENFIENNTTSSEQYNFYMQTIRDFNRRPRPQPQEPEPEPEPEPIQPEPTQQEPEPYRTPIGGVAGAVIGGSLGALASGGNPAIAGGTGAVGFLAGNALENAVRSLPAIAPPPPRPIYVPPPQTTPLDPLLFGGGFNTGGKKLRIPFNP